MFFPEGQLRVYLYGRPVDMRRSYDGLYALARNAMGLDPLSGHLFAFVNRRGTQMKILYFDRSGFLGISAHRDRPFRYRDRPFRSKVTAHFGRS